MINVILCTGIDGECKRSKLDEITKAAPAAEILTFSVGDEMSRLANVSKDRLHNLPEVDTLRKKACLEISRQIKRRTRTGNKIVIVATRALYYHQSQPKFTLDKTHNILKSVSCLNMVDDIQDMRNRMKNVKRWQTMSEIDLLRWRELETRSTDKWAEERRIESFLISAKEPAETFLDLISKPNKKKVYFSFPITHATKEMINKKDKFLKRLRQDFVVFDPFSMKEYDRAKQGGNGQLLAKLGKRTVARDFRLIDQCDAVVVYYPSTNYYLGKEDGEEVTLAGKRVKLDPHPQEGVFLSAGVVNEMVYSTTCKKQPKVIAIWTSKQKPSPFFSFHCTDPNGYLFEGPKAEEAFWEADPKTLI